MIFQEFVIHSMPKSLSERLVSGAEANALWSIDAAAAPKESM
jgi:hypothetical protein